MVDFAGTACLNELYLHMYVGTVCEFLVTSIHVIGLTESSGLEQRRSIEK